MVAWKMLPFTLTVAVAWVLPFPSKVGRPRARRRLFPCWCTQRLLYICAYICALHAHRARPLRFFFLNRVDNRIQAYSTRAPRFRASAEVLANYRTAPPLRTTGCLKEFESTTLPTTSHFGPLQFAPDLCSVDTLASCELCSPASTTAANCLTLVVQLGNNIPHELQRENNSLPLKHFEIFERHSRGSSD
jgi:hypothetical protein